MGEFNVMIADKAYRRKGYGYYTVILVMMWAVRYAKLKEFFVKIKKYNTPSIKMFEKIGFTFYRYNRHFEENEYRIKVTNELSKKWFQEIGMPLKLFRVCGARSFSVIFNNHFPSRVINNPPSISSKHANTLSKHTLSCIQQNTHTHASVYCTSSVSIEKSLKFSSTLLV